MSTPPDALMKLMGGGGTGAPAGPTTMSAAAPGNDAPGGGPMATPAPKEGEMQKAMTKIALVQKLLDQALPAFDGSSEEGKAVLEMLRTANKQFGEQRENSDRFANAELMELVQSFPATGGGGPAAQALGGMPASQPAMQ